MRISLEEQLEQIRAKAGLRRFGERDRLGSANLIDAAARLRAASAIVRGDTVSLSRLLRPNEDPDVSLDVTISEEFGRSPMRVGIDEVRLRCHGNRNTHVDALNHVSYDGTWYSGWPIDDPEGPSVLDWAAKCLVTRAVHVDIGAVRGAPWAQAEQPVSGADIDAALDAAGVSFVSGDALLLDLGREQYEADGRVVQQQWHAARDAMQPGIGADGAEWLLDHGVSVLCWDFLDAVHPDERRFSAHSLIWSMGQIFVDNCSFARLRPAFDEAGTSVGALVVAPLPLGGATGCNVNPIVVF